MGTPNEYMVKESPRYFWRGEGVPFEIDTGPAGGAPVAGSVSVKITDLSAAGQPVVTDSVMATGAPSINGDLIRLPKMRSMVPRSLRLEVTFTNARFDPCIAVLQVNYQ